MTELDFVQQAIASLPTDAAQTAAFLTSVHSLLKVRAASDEPVEAVDVLKISVGYLTALEQRISQLEQQL